MGFFSNLVGGIVKVAVTPVAVVKDVVDVATGNEPNATKDLIEDAIDDFGESINDLGDGEL